MKQRHTSNAAGARADRYDHGASGTAAAAAAEPAARPAPAPFKTQLAALYRKSFRQKPQPEKGEIMVLSHVLKGDVTTCFLSAWASWPGPDDAVAEAPAARPGRAAREAGRGIRSGRGRRDSGRSTDLMYSVKDILSFLPGCPPQVKEDLKNQMLDSCAAAVEAAAGLREGDRLPMKELLDLVQVDVPVAECLEEYTVPEDDPREGLWDQTGLRVKQKEDGGADVAPGQFLGFYRGEVRFRHSNDQFMWKPPKWWEQTVSSCPKLWKLAVGSYLIELEHFDIEKLRQQPGFKFKFDADLPPGQYDLCNSAYGCGNLCMRANAPQLNPWTEEAFKHGDSLAKNCHVYEVLVAGWPFHAMFTLDSIVKAGEDLRYDYGYHEYFKLNAEELAEARHAFEQAQLVRQLEREKEKLQQLVNQQQQQIAALQQQVAQLGASGGGPTGLATDGTNQPSTLAATAAAAAGDAMSADHPLPAALAAAASITEAALPGCRITASKSAAAARQEAAVRRRLQLQQAARLPLQQAAQAPQQQQQQRPGAEIPHQSRDNGTAAAADESNRQADRTAAAAQRCRQQQPKVDELLGLAGRVAGAPLGSGETSSGRPALPSRPPSSRSLGARATPQAGQVQQEELAAAAAAQQQASERMDVRRLLQQREELPAGQEEQQPQQQQSQQQQPQQAQQAQQLSSSTSACSDGGDVIDLTGTDPEPSAEGAAAALPQDDFIDLT